MPLEIKPVTSQAHWEAFVLDHSPQALFQSWLWGNVQQQLGKRVWRLGLYEADRLTAVAQVVQEVAKRGTFLHIRHGPIFSGSASVHWELFLKYLQAMTSSIGAAFIRVSPLIADSPENRNRLAQLGFIPAAIHAMDAERCWVLDLNKTEEELLAAMRKTTRYEIRRAQKAGVEVIKSVNPKDTAAFLALYRQTSQRHGFVPHEGIAEEFREFVRPNQALLFLAFYGKQPLAGAIILFYGGQAIYHHGASRPSRVSASQLLQWEAIREAKKRAMKLYNFWGIAPADKVKHPWWGITVFKKGFGGREVTYLHVHDYPTSPWYIVPRTLDVVYRWRRGY